jgi:cardiolipin synthase
VAVVGNREAARRRSIRRTYRWAIARARRTIFIANPYFIPDRSILRSLRHARARGVRVVLLLPGASDIASVQWASRATYDRLLAWGVEIFHWCRPVFHAKTAVIDASWCTVGTYNLDTQSLRYNLEVTVLIPDARVAAALERMFVDDLRACERIDRARWRMRPLWWRIPERFFYFFRSWL